MNTQTLQSGAVRSNRWMDGRTDSSRHIIGKYKDMKEHEHTSHRFLHPVADAAHSGGRSPAPLHIQTKPGCRRPPDPHPNKNGITHQRLDDTVLELCNSHALAQCQLTSRRELQSLPHWDCNRVKSPGDLRACGLQTLFCHPFHNPMQLGELCVPVLWWEQRCCS